MQDAGRGTERGLQAVREHGGSGRGGPKVGRVDRVVVGVRQVVDRGVVKVEKVVDRGMVKVGQERLAVGRPEDEVDVEVEPETPCEHRGAQYNAGPKRGLYCVEIIVM